MNPALGRTGRDVITGFEGVVMGRAEYTTGCNQLLLVPRGLKADGGRREGEWFDEQRVEFLEEVMRVTFGSTTNPGADEPVPPTR